MKEAEEFAIQTNLSRRVASWQLKLEPILEEQSQRPPFDINKYGDDVLNVVHEKRAKEKTEKLPFEEIVCGRETYDVCRMFLASLQLVSNYKRPHKLISLNKWSNIFLISVTFSNILFSPLNL